MPRQVKSQQASSQEFKQMGKRVIATKTGYYGDRIRKADDPFEIKDEAAYSFNWMKAVGWKPKDKADAPAKDEPKADAQGDGTEFDVIAAYENIEAEPEAEDLTEKGYPSKAWLDGQLEQPTSQGEYMTLLKHLSSQES